MPRHDVIRELSTNQAGCGVYKVPSSSFPAGLGFWHQARHQASLPLGGPFLENGLRRKRGYPKTVVIRQGPSTCCKDWHSYLSDRGSAVSQGYMKGLFLSMLLSCHSDIGLKHFERGSNDFVLLVSEVWVQGHWPHACGAEGRQSMMLGM